MFENDDVILPDDFETPSQEVETQEEGLEEETVSEEVDTNETEQTDEQQMEGMTEQEKKVFLQIKYNKEIVDLDEDKAKELAQMGMNYPKLQERLQALESDPRLSFVENLAKENGMTTEQFLEAFTRQREQDRLNELIQQNIPEEYAKEILENRKFREQFQAKEKEQQQQTQQQKEYQDFIDTYPNVKADEIPKEVWEIQSQGVPLKFAYMQYQNEQLQTQLKVLKQNKENQNKAPVNSVTAHGSDEVASEDDFLKGFNSI